jgi:hypothetical protein
MGFCKPSRQSLFQTLLDKAQSLAKNLTYLFKTNEAGKFRIQCIKEDYEDEDKNKNGSSIFTYVGNSETMRCTSKLR